MGDSPFPLYFSAPDPNAPKEPAAAAGSGATSAPGGVQQPGLATLASGALSADTIAAQAGVSAALHGLVPMVPPSLVR